jgi:hypothetical protein
MPEAGSDFTIMWGSCNEQDVWDNFPGLKKLIGIYDPVCFLHQGDLFYIDRDMPSSSVAQWGGNTPTRPVSSNLDDTANAYSWMRRTFHNPSYKNVMQRVPMFWMGDDHEVCNDYSLYTAGCGASATPADGTYPQYPEDMVTLYRTYNGAERDYMIGNPPNTDAGIDAVELYPAMYWRKTIGDIELFQCDAASYRKPFGNAETADKRMLETTQESWLSTKVASSTALFKVLSMNKTLFEPGAAEGNGDTYADYTTERDRLINDLSATATTVWLSGDKHSPQSFMAKPPDYSGTLLDVMASPLASSPFHGVLGSEVWDAWNEYNSEPQSQSTVSRYFCAGLVEVFGSAPAPYIVVSIVNMVGEKVISFRLESGSNTPVANVSKTGI